MSIRLSLTEFEGVRMPRKYYGVIVELDKDNSVRLGRFIHAVIIGAWSDGTTCYQECNEAGEVIDPRTCYSMKRSHGKAFYFVECIN